MKAWWRRAPMANALVSVARAFSNRRRGCRVAELLERGRLDLPDPLGGEPEVGAERAQRLRWPSEPIVAPQDCALTLVEPVGERLHPLHLEPVEHMLVLALGGRIGDHVGQRSARAD